MAVCEGLGAKLRDLQTGEQTEVEVYVPFEASDWDGLFLSVPASGALTVPGQVGPHGLPIGQYDVFVYQDDGLGWQREVNVDVRLNSLTGEVLLIRCGRSAAFSGKVVIDWARRFDQ